MHSRSKKTTAEESCGTSELRKGEAHHSDASACRRPCTRGLMSRMMSRGLITVSAYRSSYVRCVRGAGSRWGRLQHNSRLHLNADEERCGTMDFNLIKNDRLWGWSTHNTRKYLRGLWRLSIENRLDSRPKISGGLVWQNCSWFSLSHLPKDKVRGYSNGSVALINIAINWSLDATLQDSEVKAQKSSSCARAREERTKASC